jgi:Mg2+/Co2+ transporter CorB
MMAINRYRLKHLVKERHKGARRVSKLLNRTDRLLGVILIGNNFVNILASVIATLIAVRLWGDGGIFAVTILMTLLVLIFAEVTPKTIAALKPESIAFPAAIILQPLSKILKPAVSTINYISNGLTKLLGVNPEENSNDDLNPEELRTLLETSGVPDHQQKMLMGIFDMDYLSVNDVMVPRNKIVGVDIDDTIENILIKLQKIDFTYIPVFKDSLDNIQGFLTVNRKADFLGGENINHAELLKSLEEPNFIPENTALNKQLSNFQSVDTRVGLIVDEYGDIEGLITLRDILEIIVGEITSSTIEKMDIMPQSDGSFMIEGNIMIREINRRLKWNLSTNGPKTLSGLILENVQSIPETNVDISINEYRFETILIKDNVVKIAKVQKLELDLLGDETKEE